MKKRIISLFTSLVMVISLVGVVPTMTASANNPFNSAKAISLNCSYTDALLTSDDVRYYSFILNSVGKVNISFGKEYDNEGGGWQLIVYNGYQEELYCQRFDKGNSYTEKTFSLGLPKGKFYVIIKPAGYSWEVTKADYTLKVNYQKKNNWETEINNEFNSADNISLNKVYCGAVTSNEDDDFYKVSVPKTGYYDIYFGKEYDNEGGGWDVTVYNKYQNELYTQSFDKGNSKTNIWKIKLSVGDNYIKIKSGGYSWEVTPVDYNFKITQHVSNVSNFKATTTTANSVKLTWNKVSGANGYIIYRYDNAKKTWVRIGKGKHPGVYTAIKLKAGTTYKFAVKAYKTVNGKETTSAKFPTVTSSTNPATVNFKLTAGSKKVTAKWSKVTGASGYIVYYKTSKNGKWVRLKSTSNKTTSYTKTGLKKGKTYYFTVKAYRTVNKKTYNGSYTTKSIKSK